MITAKQQIFGFAYFTPVTGAGGPPTELGGNAPICLPVSQLAIVSKAGHRTKPANVPTFPPPASLNGPKGSQGLPAGCAGATVFMHDSKLRPKNCCQRPRTSHSHLPPRMTSTRGTSTRTQRQSQPTELGLRTSRRCRSLPLSPIGRLNKRKPKKSTREATLVLRFDLQRLP